MFLKFLLNVNVYISYIPVSIWYHNVVGQAVVIKYKRVLVGQTGNSQCRFIWLANNIIEVP